MTVEEYIRKLASSNEWQLKYMLSRKYGLKMLFDNVGDLSGHQLMFLKWLNTYKILNEELSNGADKLNENVLKSFIRTDAYLIWRNKKNKQVMMKNRLNEKEKPFEEGLVYEPTEEE